MSGVFDRIRQAAAPATAGRYTGRAGGLWAGCASGIPARLWETVPPAGLVASVLLLQPLWLRAGGPYRRVPGGEKAVGEGRVACYTVEMVGRRMSDPHAHTATSLPGKSLGVYGVRPERSEAGVTGEKVAPGGGTTGKRAGL